MKQSFFSFCIDLRVVWVVCESWKLLSELQAGVPWELLYVDDLMTKIQAHREHKTSTKAADHTEFLQMAVSCMGKKSHLC